MSTNTLKELIERKNKINMQIEFLNKENKEKEKKRKVLIDELAVLGEVVTPKTDVSALLISHEEAFKVQCKVLENEIEEAEKLLGI